MAVYLWIIRHNEVAKNLRVWASLGLRNAVPFKMGWNAQKPTMRTRTDFLFDICFPSFLRKKK